MLRLPNRGGLDASRGGNMPRPRGAVLREAPFSGPRQKTALPPCDRYALAQLRQSRGGDEACQATLRAVIQAGLAAMGWPEQRREVQYAEYRLTCAKTGEINEFESR